MTIVFEENQGHPFLISSKKACETAKQYAVHITDQTVRNRLKENDFHDRAAKNHSLISEIDRVVCNEPKIMQHGLYKIEKGFIDKRKK